MPNPNMGTAGLYTYNPSHVAYMASQSKDPKAYGVTPGETWKPYMGTAGMYNYSPSHVAYMAGQSKSPSAYGVTSGISAPAGWGVTGGGSQQYSTVYGQPTPTNRNFAPPVIKPQQIQYQTMQRSEPRMGGGATPYDYSKPMYTTGDNERRVVNVNGQQVRMGPNSSIYRTEPANPWKNFMDTMKGYTKPAVSNVAGVRG